MKEFFLDNYTAIVLVLALGYFIVRFVCGYYDKK